MMRECINKAGDYMRVNVFPVRRLPGAGRGAKRKPSSEAQAKYNASRSIHKATDLLNNNFGNKDCCLYLTYTLIPESVRAAIAHVQNYIRIIRYRHNKTRTKVFKYIYWTELGKKSGRIHHHLVISCDLPREELEALWEKEQGHGRARSEKLYFGVDGLQGLANYIHKTPNEEKLTYRSWNCSKNLILPEPVKRDGFISATDTAYIARVGEGARREIERKYPGYYLRGVKRPAMPEPDADGNMPPFVPELFITLYLYRKNAVYFDAGSAHDELEAAGKATWDNEDREGKRDGARQDKAVRNV